MTDYNEASKTYNNSRTASRTLVEFLGKQVRPDKESSVLDFGCGTGNYLSVMERTYGCKCYGVDPSGGMRAIAVTNNPNCTIVKGDHTAIPFDDLFFDLIYMTDVIHHVPDISAMFHTLARALKGDGSLCVVTESWEQIGRRWYNNYFPSLEANEKQRYPDIDRIVESATANNLVLRELVVIPHDQPAIIDDNFLRLVEEKNYSMFSNISESEHTAGLQRLQRDKGTTVHQFGSGETIVWFRKECAKTCRGS